MIYLYKYIYNNNIYRYKYIFIELFDATISGNRCPPAVLEKAKGKRHSYLALLASVR